MMCSKPDSKRQPVDAATPTIGLALEQDQYGTPVVVSATGFTNELESLPIDDGGGGRTYYVWRKADE